MYDNGVCVASENKSVPKVDKAKPELKEYLNSGQMPIVPVVMSIDLG